MSNLLRKPFGTHGKVHEITAVSAGWCYVGFSLHRLRQGERVAEAIGSDEAILVMVEGKARFRAAGRDWGTLGERMDVFDKTPPHCLYVPNDSDWEAVAATDCTIAVCLAPGPGGHPARRIGPDGIALTARGKGTNTRHVNNIAMEKRTSATRSSSRKSSPRRDTGRATRLTGTSRTTARASPTSRRPTATASTRPRASASSASMTVVWTRQWRSWMMISCWSRAGTILAARPTASRCTTSTSWPVRSGSGASCPTRPWSG